MTISPCTPRKNSASESLPPADLVPPGVGLTNVSLNVTSKDDTYHNVLLGLFKPYVKEELFKPFVLALPYPSNSLDRITQEVTDSLGNTMRISVHTYFTNIFTALQCMTGHLDKDICLYAVENLCQDI